VLVTSLAGYVDVFGAPSPDSPLDLAVQDFYRQGGSVAFVVRAAGDPGPVDAPAYARALNALRRTDLVNLLVIPGDLPAETVTVAVAFAEERRVLLLLDPPSAWTTVEAAVAGAGSTAFARSPNLAAYFPRIRRPGPARAASGAVAGLMARNDVTRGVWKAPAGVEACLEGVEELDLAVNDVDAGRLNVLGVNCLRTFPGTGPVVWGARTTATTDPEWKYVSVRRTALFLEKSIDFGTRWATFEPNDEPLWARLRTELGSFLDDLFRRGAFPASSPKDAYFVRCDATTTTQADIADGVVNIVVGFAPLKPAEFVNIRIAQAAGQTGSPA
jgi:phage tail sheath protein FI